ncbi:MAG TPA: response regulator [Erysipelothrix sp.]
MLKVIIIDDESLTRQGLIEFVDWNKHGYEVFGEAEDGNKGLELAKQVHPDLAICDIRMPHMDGIEFAKKLQEIVPECKVIFLSGYSDKEYLKSAIKLNAVDYLEKPLNMDELYTLLDRVKLEYDHIVERMNKENKMLVKLEQNNQFLLDSIIDNLLEEQACDRDSLATLLKHMNIDFPLEGIYRTVVIKNAPQRISNLILNTLKQKKKENQMMMLIGRRVNEIIIIHEQQVSLRELKRFYDELMYDIEKNEAINLELGVGDKVEKLEMIEDAYDSAISVIDWLGYKNPNRLVFDDGTNVGNSAIRDTERFITDNFDKRLTIKDIAEEVFLTPQYLCKIFKEETGHTINSYITDLRMEKAKELLLNRNLKLYEVAAQLGYRDANYFARVFKRNFGMNPSEFREKHNV